MTGHNLKLYNLLRWFLRFKLTYVGISLITVISILLSIVQIPVGSAVEAKTCYLPTAGSTVENPSEINNINASRSVKFTIVQANNSQNCYLSDTGLTSPLLRVNPARSSKIITLQLTNKLPISSGAVQNHNMQEVATKSDKCTGDMSQNSTNLHFHGLSVSPKCGQDEVVKTVIAPNESFDYRVKIPEKLPPGLYWYHPHVHGNSQEQVLSGLTGAIVVEGIGKFNQKAARLPERVLVLRDMEPLKDWTQDTEAPWKDISINHVPIRYQGNSVYDKPAVIKVEPEKEMFWRVVNAGADTYFDLQLVYDGVKQNLDIVGIDGVPINADNSKKNQVLTVDHIIMPPGARAEFIIKTPGANIKQAYLKTKKYDTKGDNHAERNIAIIETKSLRSVLNSQDNTNIDNIDLQQISGDRFSGLRNEKSVVTRKLYFSQDDAKNEFYITEFGKTPKAYAMGEPPAITVKEGVTEDWIVENHAKEEHVFHIHQIHFLVIENGNYPADRSPQDIGVGMVRDTVTIPAWDGNSSTYPYVKLRMDFRGKGSSIAGTFVYHCHILEHEDNGMMAAIEVKR